MKNKARYEFGEPESCWDCEMRVTVSTSDRARPGGIDYECNLVGDFVFHNSESRHPDCPLKIVPETPEGELKPCPFCGGEAKYFHAYGYHDAQCQNCYAAPFKHSDKEGAIAAWNRREGWL